MTFDMTGVHKSKSLIFKQATPWPSKIPAIRGVTLQLRYTIHETKLAVKSASTINAVNDRSDDATEKTTFSSRRFKG